jgi:Fic family protein
VAICRFVNIHPFIDGNGRTARLLMNCVLSGWDFPFFTVPGRASAAYLDAVRNAQLREADSFVIDLDGGFGCFSEFVRVCAHFENELLDKYLSVCTQAALDCG